MLKVIKSIFVRQLFAYIDDCPSLRFSQDNDHGHKAASTRRLSEQAGVSIISWPALSPDLNPIETVWNKLKDWLGQHYPDHKCSYEELRRRVQEAWEALQEGRLREIMDTMHQRCQDGDRGRRDVYKVVATVR